MAEIVPTAPTVDIYPSPVQGQDYLAVFNFNSNDPLPEPTAAAAQKLRTVVILDQSGSMGPWVKVLNTFILPEVFEQLGYDQEYEIDLILFESTSTHHVHKVSEFPTLPYDAAGGTQMEPVFPLLNAIFEAAEDNTHFRLITISDGEVWSPSLVMEAASKLFESSKSLIAIKGLTISSSALRLFTSTYANPDTQALSSILQFNTTADTPALLDLDPNLAKYKDNTLLSFTDCISTIFAAIGNAVPKAYLGLSGIYPTILPPTDDRSIFKAQPWASSSAFITMADKKVLFWLDAAHVNKAALPKFTLSDSIEITPIFHENLTPETYELLITSRIEYYMMQVKLLHVVGTPTSRATLTKIANYFISLENVLYTDLLQTNIEADKMGEDIDVAVSALHYKERLRQLRAKYTKIGGSLRHRMLELINLDAHAGFNAAQAAAFLRQTGPTKTAKNLSRRHGADLDFTSILREEVFALARSLKDFESTLPSGFEDSLPQSFVSLANTMDGLRSICSLASTSVFGEEIPLQAPGEEDPNAEATILESLNDVEILSFFNLVGIPCQGTIGDYPDPYRYNINVIFSGNYCSLSDLIIHAELRKNSAPGETPSQLSIPGYKNEFGRIDNVIPVLPPLLFNFIYQNAPHVLQYYASIGMRRVIADIPGTLPATLSTALLKMMKIVCINPNEVNVNALVDLYQGFKAASSIRFNQPQYDELFTAIHTADEIEKSIDNGMNDTPVSEEVVGENDIVQLQSSTTKLVSPTGKFLPAITQSLSQMLLPMIQLYRLTAQHDQGINVDSMGKSAKSILSTNPNAALTPEALETEMKLVQQHLPTVFRAMYANEVWNTLRSQYNGKPDKVQIIEKGLNDLIGFNKAFVPELSPYFHEDLDFDPFIHIPKGESATFYESDSYQDLQKRLNKFNVLFALPQFGDLFAAVEAGKSIGELTSLAQRTIPRLLSSLETVDQLQENQLHNDPQLVYSQSTKDYLESRHGEVQMAKDELLTALPRASFGLTQPQSISAAHFDHIKLVNIIYAFKYPESSARYNAVVDTANSIFGAAAGTKQLYTSNIPDYLFDATSPINCQVLAFFGDLRTNFYKSIYANAVANKAKCLASQIGLKYVETIVAHDNIDTFITALQDGISFSPKHSYSFKNHQDSCFHMFWKKLLSKEEEIPLRLKKLRYTILGVTENGDNVWNNGRVLFHHSLHPAAHFFYDADERDEWIEICKQHAEGRKKWEYRDSDIPNRHYHHISRPSYFALGYDTLIDFKKAVSKEEWDIYCQEHHFCCGIRDDIKKPTWFKLSTERSAEDYKDAPKCNAKNFDSTPSLTAD